MGLFYFSIFYFLMIGGRSRCPNFLPILTKSCSRWICRVSKLPLHIKVILHDAESKINILRVSHAAIVTF